MPNENVSASDCASADALDAVGIVIPALRPDGALLDLVSALVRAGFAEIIVVDDGSGPQSAPIFQLVQEHAECTVLTHEVNQGKGRALKTALKFCMAKRPAISDVVTCDADGQHAVEDIVLVANKLLVNRATNENVVVWGSRDFDGEDIPWKSRFGNKATSQLVRLVFGRYIADTQTGLRGFPVEMLSTLIPVSGEQFDYEMNVLINLLESGADICEVPIRTIYLDTTNSHTHFRPIRDSLQILLRLGKFALSSMTGAIVDLALYATLVNLLFDGTPDGRGIVICVVLARIVSSFVNFMLNRDWVFRSGVPRAVALARYYGLAIVIMTGSAVGSVLLSRVLAGHVVWAKMIVDGLLFIASYEIQQGWVFRHAALSDDE